VQDDEGKAEASRPTVAVVVPVHNTGTLLVETVESIRRQSQPCELILVDDGSTDSETLEVLASLDLTDLLLIRQQNAGASAARNAAIRATRATYILPVDADDLIEPDYVQQAVDVLERRPEVGVVYCRADRFGKAQGPWELPPYDPGAMAVDNVVFATAMFRRADWEVVGGYDEGLRHGGEDWDFWLSLIELGREVVQLPDVLFHYRIHGEPRNFLRRDLAGLYASVFRKHERFFLEHLDVIYERRFEMQDELRRLRRIEDRATRLRRVMPPLSKWLRS
jgi:glycosyltransferase involved in cell wall biosynthesis